MEYAKAKESVKQNAIKFDYENISPGESEGYIKLIDYIGDAQIVLLGEATHGTKQFYDIRAEITKLLITQKNFNAIAIEGDWPDAYQVNLYINNKEYNSASDALSSFSRFPTWMWANKSILSLIEWLKEHNSKQEEPNKKNNRIGFFGLDLYSLYSSIEAVINTLEKIDPKAAQEAKEYYSCFDQYKYNPQAYGYAVFLRIIRSCSKEVLESLQKILAKDYSKLEQDKNLSDETFYIEQNARVIKNAENYYRSMFINENSNWNLRDSHMFEILKHLVEYYKSQGVKEPKIIVWAHNSHIGNAAATEMAERGEYNIGQLAKEYYRQKAISIGFSTYSGTVSAASNWDAPVERKNIRPALEHSYEDLFHNANIPNFWLPLKDKSIIPQILLERAIGVIYAPLTERASHYFYANMPYQFDAIIHIDKTDALEPLAKTEEWIQGEIPDIFPSGL